MRADVVIVGGGVIGSAVAYFLASSPEFSGRVCVVERDPTYQFGSTARSAGSIRQQFSTAENIAMSQFGIGFLRAAGELLEVDGVRPDIGLREAGYLFLASAAGRETLRANHALQTSMGADIAWLTPEQLSARYPWLHVGDLAAGCLGRSGEGWFDPYSLLQALRRKARSLGVEYLHDEVTGLVRGADGIAAVQLAGAGRLACGQVVNAAGPSAARVAAMAGVTLPVVPRKRCVFTFRCPAPLEACPLVIDPSGAYFRPEGDGYICGISPPADADPDCTDHEVDYALFEERLWPLLAERVPAFETLRAGRAWAGHYAYNTLDQNAILGVHPECSNLLLANGFSGHGLQQAPAVGRGLAELICHGAYRSLDLGRFGYRRVVEGRPLAELNVV